MAQYYTNFGNYYVSPDDIDWDLGLNFVVQEDQNAVGGRYLYRDSGSVQGWARWTPTDGSDVEVVVKVYVSETDSVANTYAILRAHEDLADDNKYLAKINSSGDLEILIRENSFTPDSLATGTTGASSSSDYWIRFRANGTDLSARAWNDGDSEPGSWEVQTTDSTYSSGMAGVYTFRAAIDVFGGATAGDTAPIQPTGSETTYVGANLVRLDGRGVISTTTGRSMMWSDFNPQSQTNIDTSDSEAPTLSTGSTTGSFTTQEDT